jgi:hypothetical protein
MVHFRSSLLFMPDEINLTVSPDAHHKHSLRMQLRAV